MAFGAPIVALIPLSAAVLSLSEKAVGAIQVLFRGGRTSKKARIESAWAKVQRLKMEALSAEIAAYEADTQ